MDIFDKAKELGSLIADSKEMMELKKREAVVEADSKAKLLMNDYKLLQLELVRAAREKKEQAITESIKKRLLDKQKQLNEYEPTVKYLEAKTAFDRLMKNVNEVITFIITGEDGCSSGKCGSCGKGCK